MKNWVVINETDDYIICMGISTDYYKAVGILYTKFTDVIDDWIKNGYRMIEKNEWCPLEADSGFGFYATFERINDIGYKTTIHEKWYLLDHEQED